MVTFRGSKKAWATPRSVFFRGLIQNFGRASPPLSYAESPPHYRLHKSCIIRLLYALWYRALESGFDASWVQKKTHFVPHNRFVKVPWYVDLISCLVRGC